MKIIFFHRISPQFLQRIHQRFSPKNPDLAVNRLSFRGIGKALTTASVAFPDSGFFKKKCKKCSELRCQKFFHRKAPAAFSDKTVEAVDF